MVVACSSTASSGMEWGLGGGAEEGGGGGGDLHYNVP